MKNRLFVLLATSVLLGCAGPAPAPEREPLPTPERYLVVLDAGHGGFDAGASGTDTGVKESDLNLQVALLVQAALEDAGVRVLMTRTDGGALGSTKKEDMARRGQLLGTEGADAAVSIHMNKFSDRRVRGPMVYYQAGAEPALAQCVMDSLTEALGRKPRLANPGNNFVTRVPACPAVLVECGFLSHPQEELLLQEPEYQRAIAEAIARGVLTFLEEKEEKAHGNAMTPFVLFSNHFINFCAVLSKNGQRGKDRISTAASATKA